MVCFRPADLRKLSADFRSFLFVFAWINGIFEDKTAAKTNQIRRLFGLPLLAIAAVDRHVDEDGCSLCCALKNKACEVRSKLSEKDKALASG